MRAMDLDHRYPSVPYLAEAARRRLPHFLWEFLDSATGDGDPADHANREALGRVALMPAVLRGKPKPDLETEFMGRRYKVPFGIAPVGMSGVFWPGAETILAKAAAAAGMPYCQSTMAATTPEAVGPHLGDMGWFQLYPPKEAETRRDICRRAKAAGFHTLVMTIDLPGASRRERQRRADVRQPPALTPRVLRDCALRPVWALQRLAHGKPRLQTLDPYVEAQPSLPGTNHVGYLIREAPDWDYLKALRDEWDGPLILKGVMDPEPVARMIEEGVDALWVSNHGGRQFAAAPAALDVLPRIREIVGPDYPLVFCSGVRSGTDVLRAIACGADMVMLGRAWQYGVSALGPDGAAQVFHILKDGMMADMYQMGIERPEDVRGRRAD